MKITITTSDYSTPELDKLSGALADGAAIHNRVAKDGEKFIKTAGARIAADASNHRSSSRLGARPTNHLVRAYQAIESASTADSASLLIPRASRLRAAFGRYVLTPRNGSKFLTIPVAAEAYGRRAGEFTDLIFLRVGPRKTAILARPDADGGITTMYLLTPKAEIPEDKGLIPFEQLEEKAEISVGEYLDDALEATLN